MDRNIIYIVQGTIDEEGMPLPLERLLHTFPILEAGSSSPLQPDGRRAFSARGFIRIDDDLSAALAVEGLRQLSIQLPTFRFTAFDEGDYILNGGVDIKKGQFFRDPQRLDEVRAALASSASSDATEAVASAAPVTLGDHFAPRTLEGYMKRDEVVLLARRGEITADTPLQAAASLILSSAQYRRE